MTPQWAVRLPKNQCRALGRLRTTSGIELHETEGDVWLTGTARSEALDRELLLLPGASRFTVLTDGQLLAWGQRVPLGYLPEGTWQPLASWLEVEIPPAAFPARSWHGVTLRIEPNHEETPATVLVTTLGTWRQYCVTAAEIRLRPLMFAVAEDGRVLVRGAPLPPLPGERYVETCGIAVPCGFAIVPRLDRELIAQLLELSAGDLALFDQAGGYERIAAGDFVRASRSAARLTAQQVMAEAFTENDLTLLARRYFTPEGPTFWQWADGGQVITWANGETIIFRQELRQIVEQLAPAGLPHFGALLLLLAACRESWIESRSEHEVMRDLWQQAKQGPGWLIHVLEGLDRLARLPREHRNTTDAKALLAEVVFEGKRNTPDDVAAGAIAALREGMVPDCLGPHSNPGLRGRPHRTAMASLIHSLTGFCSGQVDLSPETLRLRGKTGLEQLVEPAEVELEPADDLRAFIAQLRSDPELAGLGRLTQDLLAAVTIPRAVSQPDEMPQGGVSDIANRGPLDRLLVSELAHDDLTLAVRIALNEALYLRREIPPQVPATERILLIDSGIRQWGVPRVFATAVALALAATGDKHSRVDCFRAHTDRIEPAELGTREGLIRQLEFLSPAPHPGGALAPFLRRIEEVEGAAEAVLVTHADVLADPEFRRELAQLDGRAIFVATVDRQGHFQLLQVTHRGQKRIREAVLDLDRVLKTEPTSPLRRPLIRHPTGGEFPAILSVAPFPLLLSHQVDYRHAAYREGFGAVTVTNDGRLMHWSRKGLGGKQLTDEFPAGQMHFIEIDSVGVVRVVAGNPLRDELRLLKANLITGEYRSCVLEIDGKEVRTVFQHNNTLFDIDKRAVHVISLDGAPVGKDMFFGPFRWVHGRFFRIGETWHALSYDGSAAEWQPVPRVGTSHGPVKLLFDREGLPGPWAITETGDIFSTAEARRIEFKLGEPIEVHSISRDGHRLIVRRTAPKMRRAHLLLDLGTRLYPVLNGTAQARAVSPDLYLMLEPGLGQSIALRNLRCRFQGIGVDEAGRLFLIARKGNPLTIDFVRNERLELLPWGLTEHRSPRSRVANFKPTVSPRGTKYELKVATWKDGSRAFLDSRGLLHLISEDRELPEITLVLADDGVAGWSSDGRVWGATYYTGLPHRKEDVAWDEILQFAARLR